MQGDRQNHTGSPCSPVIHLLSQKWPFVDILLRGVQGQKCEKWPNFWVNLKSLKSWQYDWYDEVITRKLLYNQSTVYLCKEGDKINQMLFWGI